MVKTTDTKPSKQQIRRIQRKSFRSSLLCMFSKASIISKVTLCLLLLQPKDQQQLPGPGVSSDPFEVFIAEQGKREAEWSSIRAAKKQKVDDRRTSSKDGWQEEVAENVEELKRQLDEKNTECATLKGQLAELQRASVELLSKNQENVCKVITRVLAFSTVKVTVPFNNTGTLKIKAETD